MIWVHSLIYAQLEKQSWCLTQRLKLKDLVKAQGWQSTWSLWKKQQKQNHKEGVSKSAYKFGPHPLLNNKLYRFRRHLQGAKRVSDNSLTLKELSRDISFCSPWETNVQFNFRRINYLWREKNPTTLRMITVQFIT